MAAPIDWLVLTAANRVQARGYVSQLEERAARQALAECKRWMVVPDPGGRRAGSGGSTLWVLYRLADALARECADKASLGDVFAGRRVVIVHSGGDSRRLCAYAAQGKLFVPLPADTTDGEPAALFDLLLRNISALPAPAAGQILIASGDVLLTFDPGTVDFNRPGLTGVAYLGPMERGRHHGVYVADRAGCVLDFLQKPDEETARSRRAMDDVGRVMVDTGLLSLDPAVAGRWLAAAGVKKRKGSVDVAPGLLNDIASGKCPPLDLYEQFLMALPPGRDLPSYLTLVSGSTGGIGAHRRRLRSLYRILHGCPFHVNVLPYCEFFHIGSSRELLSNIGLLNRTARTYGFSNFHRSSVAGRASLECAFVYNSFLESKEISAGQDVLIEGVHTDQPLLLPGRNIVVGYPKEARTPLRLPEGMGLVCLPVRPGRSSGRQPREPGTLPWSAVLFGIGEDFKSSGRWDKRIWPIGPVDQVLREVLGDGGGSSPVSRKARVPAGLPRVSLGELLALVDHDRILLQRREIRRLVDLRTCGELLERDPWLPASRVISFIRTREDSAAVMRQIDSLLDRIGDFPQRARLFRLAHLIHRNYRAALPSRPTLRGSALERAAFDAVAGAVAQEITISDRPRRLCIQRDQVVWVTCPVRLDFMGGWSDTPPICVELGGATLNAAVTLNGQYPVQVIAKRTDRPAIKLTSLDLGQRVELSETPHACEYQNPADWSALPKAALVLAGGCPPDPGKPLKRWLGSLGGGLDIALFSALPKGSGLGTSSILGAAMLACLARVLDEPLSQESLIARTSNLEQLMTTGGGWQDQIGGITPGVKLIRTDPGARQTPRLHWVPFDMSPAGPFGSRLLLFYTGYKRMARHILQSVVNRYLSRDPAAIALIRRLKAEAEKMQSALASGDVEEFGRGIDCYWELKKALDPGSTNKQIEALLKPLSRYLTGKVLPGAGGGGFIFMVARDAESALLVRRTLERNPPNSLARFFDFDIDRKGLSVTVL